MKTINLLQQTAILGLVGSTILLTPFTSKALTVEEVINPQTSSNRWVTDMADILSQDTEAELNRLITNLEKTNGAEIAVVTVPETAPADSPKAFATQLFNHWGIGKAESDNGILFLVSTADRRVEIETGYGIEGILPDAQVGNIIDTQITPQYKQGNYNRGTLDGTTALISSLDTSVVEGEREIQTPATKSTWNILAILTAIGITLAGGFFWRKNRNRLLINPDQAITTLKRTDFRVPCCAKCQKPMEKIDGIELTKIQQVAKKIGSVSYRGYKCSSCSNALQPYSLIAYTSSSDRYQECPKCQDFTVTRTKEILQKATRSSTGKLLVKDKCHCCSYSQEKTEAIPRLRPKYTSSRSNSSGSYYVGGGFSGGGGCSGGGSSGGGFGGGSSGGGGAGGGW